MTVCGMLGWTSATRNSRSVSVRSSIRPRPKTMTAIKATRARRNSSNQPHRSPGCRITRNNAITSETENHTTRNETP